MVCFCSTHYFKEMEYYQFERSLRVVFLCVLLSPLVLGQSWRSKDWLERYEDTVHEIAARNLSDIIDQLPGIDCSVRPDWPGPLVSFKFTCDVLPASDEIPTSVHRLRPADIKVIAALGDSLTAASGASACFLPELLYQYRGRTFSHGGDLSYEKNPSLANILRKYNTNLKGYANGTGSWDKVNSGMNVGVPGHEAHHTVQQARNLVTKMKQDESIDYENDWKVVTLFIGGNDVCSWCEDKEFYHPDMYVEYIRQALMVLHDEMPRAFVNVLSTIQVDAVRVLRGFVCDSFHYAFCPCVINVDEKDLIKVQQTTAAYQRQLEDFINSGYFDDKEDFTVVLQPFIENTIIPVLEDGTPDASYFAPDCFHLSSKGHAVAGQELWNNMVEPVGSKRRKWDIDGPLVCPTEEKPYLYTNINSGTNELFTSEQPDDQPRGSASKQSLHILNIIVFGIIYLTMSGILRYGVNA